MAVWRSGSHGLKRQSLACIALLLGALQVSAWTQQDASPIAAVAAPLTLSSPLDYQVFQRETRTKGKIVVVGRAYLEADTAEARVTGTSILSHPLKGKWQRLSFDRSTQNFYGDLRTTAGGFYQVEIKLHNRTSLVADYMVRHVGVGEVFVVAGQSNATNYGEVRQKTQTRMVVSFDGLTWAIADDPQPGVQDHSTKGSFIPAFGDALYGKYHVPIGIADVGHGSTSVRQWLPKGEPVLVPPTMSKFVERDATGTLVSDGRLFAGMMTRIDQLGKDGFRALLWHQGESDANQQPDHQISAQEYQAMQERIIRASRAQAGWDFPWFIAEATYHTPQDPSCEPIRAAQRELWRKGIALEGPDTDTLTAAYRQNQGKGVHFNDAGLKEHGNLWAESVEAYLDGLLR
ncbi:MAG TPA: sialate O-acetylesterase [Acidobacteriaceae bacterium]